MDKLDKGFPTSSPSTVALVVQLHTSCTNSFFGTPMRNDFLLQLTCIRIPVHSQIPLQIFFHFVLARIVAFCFVLIIQCGKPANNHYKPKDKTMDYYESAEDLIISRDRAIQELINHGCIPQSCGDYANTANGDFHEFFQDLGDKSEYNAQDVLDWLGY